MDDEHLHIPRLARKERLYIMGLKGQGDPVVVTRQGLKDGKAASPPARRGQALDHGTFQRVPPSQMGKDKA